MKETLLPLHLQFFAEDETEEMEAEETEKQEESQEKDEEQEQADKEGKEKTFTRKDLGKMVAAEIAKEKAKWEKEAQRRLNEELSEAERLSKLSEKDRAKEEEKKRLKALEERERKVALAELLSATRVQLASEGVPESFAPRIKGETAEEISEDIKAFREEWDRAIEKEVNQRLKQKTPKTGSTGSNASRGQQLAAEINKEKEPLKIKGWD